MTFGGTLTFKWRSAPSRRQETAARPRGVLKAASHHSSWLGGDGLMRTWLMPFAAGCGWMPATLWSSHTSDDANIGWSCEKTLSEKNHDSHSVVAFAKGFDIIHP